MPDKNKIKIAMDATEDMFKAIPKSKRLDYIGHLNEILITLERCLAVAPESVD